MESATVENFGLGTLHTAQQRFILSPATSKLYLGGIGSGKTAIGLLQCLSEALSPANKGLPIGVFAPTFRQSKRIHVARILEMFEHWERTKGWSLLRRFHRSDFIMELRGGAELWFLSFAKDTDRLRGIELAGAYVDEIEQVPDPQAIWSLISGRVRIGSSKMWGTTSAKGYRGVPKLFMEAIKGGSKSHFMVISKSYDNPYLPSGIVEEWRKTYSKRAFRAEVECSLLRSPDVVFPEFSKKLWPHGHLIKYSHKKGSRWWLSCDWGYSHASFLCWAKINVDGHEVDVCFRELNPDDTPAETQRQMIRNLAQEMGREPEGCFSDRADPGQNKWLMREFRSSHVTTMKTKAQQSQWAGVEVFRALLDPAGSGQQENTAPPRVAFSTDLLHSDSDRGIIKSMEMLRRRKVNDELIDEVLKCNVFDHVTDSAFYWAKGSHGMIGAYSL